MMGTPIPLLTAGAGIDVAVLDTDAKRVELTSGSKLHAWKREEASQLAALVTTLPNSAIVEIDEIVVLRRDSASGWAEAPRKGATVIDMRSSEPARSHDLGKTLEGMGLESGHAATALNNYVSATALMPAVEVLHVAERFGIDPQVMTDLLNASSGRSNTSENRVKRFMLSGTWASGFATLLMDKNVKIARAPAETVDYPLPLGKYAIALWRELSHRRPQSSIPRYTV